ncbi:hypothetical protein [Dactylosporangium sp. NPDC048998]|uniref:hypothetical protein n=1 Tax=Dactylosporangium sp. NPDC048998 TaxID=3363976 RepID=UPI00371287A0
MTTTIPTQRPPRPELDEDGFDELGIWRPTKEELTASIQRALDEIGITREELTRQAETGEFQCWWARALWDLIEVGGA